jgi:hypothetical protein
MVCLQKNQSFRNDLHREYLLTQGHRIYAASGDANKGYSAMLEAAFAKMRKANVSYVMFVSFCSSVRPNEKTLLPVDLFFKRNMTLEDFSKIRREKNAFHENLTTITGTLYMKTYKHF